MTMRIAVIDVGSNSIHMVVAQVESDGRFQVLDRAKEMVRLGHRTLANGSLSAEAMNTALRTLAVFRTLAERHGVARFTAVATSAVREARNGGDFVQRVKDQLGLRVKVIPGREEARLIYLGVRQALDLRGAATLIVDAGGGSVELVLTEDDEAIAMDSLKIGVARLSQKFVSTDPLAPRQLATLEVFLAEQLDPVLERFPRPSIRRIVGTSGTMLNLIAMAGYLRGEVPEVHLNNFAVSADDMARLRRLLVRADREQRLRFKGLNAKRVDLIVAGACLADYLLRRLSAKQIVACTWALREGLLLDFIARHHKGIEETARFSDPRRRSIARFARHLGDTGSHGEQVARLALQLFDQLQSVLCLALEARQWLEFAALLHDIGHHIGHKDHHRHSYYLITNGELLGFGREELEIIAQVARYHRKAPPRDSDQLYAALPKHARRAVRTLSAVLRVADGLDRSHYGVVHQLTVVRRASRLVLELHTGGDDAQLEIWEARRRTAPLEELLGVQIDFQVAFREQASHAYRAACAE